MNRQRRTDLREATELLQQALRIVDSAQEAEQDALDSMPENLEYTARFEQMEFAVDCLEEASENIGDAIDRISEAIV